MLEIGPEAGRTYNLDLRDGSVNCTPMLIRSMESLPIPEYSYGYFLAGARHFTQRGSACLLHQVFITHKGSGRFLLDGREYVAGPNTICLLNLQKPHRYETAGDLWEYEWVNFRGPSCDYYEEMINPEGFTIYDLRDDLTLMARMQDIRASVERIGLMEFVQTGTRILCLLDAFCSFVAEYQQTRLPNCHENIMTAVHYIDEHYMERVTLDMLADMAFLSKYYFTRAFSRYKGMTPYKYLNSVRLSHARQMLLTTAYTIDEIGWRVGYGGSKNLIRAFSCATGVTPAQYRRKMIEDIS